MYQVDTYFVKAETGMDPNFVIGGPVYTGENNDIEIGKIVDYDKKKGYLKIRLHETLDYRSLIKSGIPIQNIVFKYTA